MNYQKLLSIVGTLIWGTVHLAFVLIGAVIALLSFGLLRMFLILPLGALAELLTTTFDSDFDWMTDWLSNLSLPRMALGVFAVWALIIPIAYTIGYG